MPYNHFFLVAALKPRMNTDIHWYLNGGILSKMNPN